MNGFSSDLANVVVMETIVSAENDFSKHELQSLRRGKKLESWFY